MKRKIFSWINKPWAMELLPGINTVGRNPTNMIRISDASVSSFHCEIIWEEGLITVRDLASTNGTFIEDQPVKEAVLLNDQTLRLGKVSFRVEEVEAQEEPVEPPTPSKALTESVTEIIHAPKKPASSLFGRLTQTLKLPFGG